MALIKCPECEKDISDKSKACPHCGFPFPEQTLQENKIVFDSVKEPEKKVILVNEQATKTSFWGYPAAKILLGLVIVSLCLSAFSIYTSQKASGLEQKLLAAVQKTSSLDQKMQTIETDVDFLTERLQLINLGVTASERIVTDKVVVQYALFFSAAQGEMAGSIDIRPQPSYEYRFLGRGEFDMTDRELKSMLEELMNEVVIFVEPVKVISGLDLKTISITANNYSVAEYKDGVITLAGE